jgi:hypothetical protein
MSSKNSDTEQLPAFEQFRSYCENRFPSVITDNIDILYFLRWSGDEHHGRRERWKRRLVRALFQEYYSLTSALHRECGAAELDSLDVLVPFTNTCRREYQPFIYTALNRLNDDIDIGVFTSKKMCLRDVDRTLYDDASFIFEEDLISLELYRKARRDYRELKPTIDELCNSIDLQETERRDTHRFFKRYFIDEHIFHRLLSEMEPEILYSVQYNSNRGYLRAIEEYRDRSPLPNIVVQHGAFRDIHFHPFAGADHAVLWGEHFQKVLEGIRIPEQPSSVHVLGNPNLESKRAKLSPSSRGPDGEPTLLYASTGSPFGEQALSMFAEVAFREEEIEVVYKPHPHGEKVKYEPLQERGLVRSDQIRPEADIYELAVEADVVFGTQTSVLPEAVAFDTPAIQLLPDPSTEDWREYGLRHVASRAELAEDIHRIATVDGYVADLLDRESELAKQMFGDLDGSASRIAGLVEALIGD